MPQYAIAYAPNLSGPQPSDTSKTGSFYIGGMISGRVWNQVVPQTTTNTAFFASPIANVNNTSPYIIAIPANGGSIDPRFPPITDMPSFFYSRTGGITVLSDPAFIETCDYLLKNYMVDGAPATTPGTGANPVGCLSVGDCQTKVDAVGWFQSYGFVIP
jgi:hypothetical protein